MAERGNSQVEPQKISCGFLSALGSAFLEWLLILLLFIHAIFSYLITRFARYCDLQTPCLLCSRLDHVLGNEKLKYYQDLICSNHKLEVSSLVFCHAHNKLVDVCGMCENCLFSFATVNKSNAETYRLLVGKLGEDSSFGFDEDILLESHKSSQSSIRHCSCCNEPWIRRGLAENLIKTKFSGPEAAELDASFSGAGEHNRHYLEGSDKPFVSVSATHLRSNGLLPLSRVEYRELKVTSDVESEVLSSDDDDDESALIHETDDLKEDLAAHFVQLEPHIFTLYHDSALEKLPDPVSEPRPSLTISKQVEPDVAEPPSGISVASAAAVGHGVLEELNWEQVDVKADPSALSELISFDDVLPSSNVEKTSTDVSNERKIISFNGVLPSSNVVSNERELVPNPAASQENSAESLIYVSKESKLISVNDQLPSSNVGKTYMDVTKDTEFVYNHVPTPKSSGKNRLDVSIESKLSSLYEVPRSSTAVETSVNVSEECKLISVIDAPPSSKGGNNPSELSNVSKVIMLGDVQSSSNDMVSASEEQNESSNCGGSPSEVSHSNEVSFLGDVLPSSTNMVSSSEVQKESCVTRSDELVETSVRQSEEICEAGILHCTLNETAVGRNTISSDTAPQASNLLDLSDAYKVAVGNRGRQLSGVLAENWNDKDFTRVSEDLKLLLSQLSATRGFDQFLLETSPKVSANSDGLKTQDTFSSNGMQILQRKLSLERNESGLESLDGSTVSEIEGESVVDRLKRQVEHDKKLLSALYKELEEERNASTIAVNQAMAMITRLQEQKASLHMEALQNLRMMEEQAEYDTEALQKTNDLLTEKEKEIQDLEEELEYYRRKHPNESIFEGIIELTPELKEKEIMMDHKEFTWVEESATTLKNSMIQKPKTDKSSEDVNVRAVKNSLLEFEDERLYILEGLKKLEKKLYMFSYNGLCSDLANGNHSGNEGYEVTDSNDLNCKEDSQENSRAERNDSSILDDTCESRGSPRVQEHFSSLEKPHFTSKENSKLDCSEQSSPTLSKGTNLASLEQEFSDLIERLEALESDQNFLELTINSLKKGEEGVQFIQEIASHLRELRRIGVRRRDRNFV